MEFTKQKVACKYASFEVGCANSVFGQFCETICGFCAVIYIESKWVCRHIKVSYDLEQNVTNAKTQFDLAVNPL